MKKVTVRKAQQKITSKALGMPIAVYIIDVLCLRDRFSAVTIKKGKNSEFSTVDMCVGIIAIIMLECERMSHIDTSFSGEAALAQQLGLKRFFSASTAYRFIRKFAGWHVNQLSRINSLLLRENGQSVQASNKIVDADGSTHSMESRKREKGKDTYIAEIPRLRVFSGSDKEFRFLLVKERKRVKKVKKGPVFYTYEWQYWGIVTNIPSSEMNSYELFTFYRGRQTIENFFRETKQSFNSGKMPSQKFRGNEACLWFVCIAYNISVWFKRDVLPKKHSRCMMKTVRQRLNTAALCNDTPE